MVGSLLALAQERSVLEYRTKGMLRELELISTHQQLDVQPDKPFPLLDDATLLYALEDISYANTLDILSVSLEKGANQKWLNSYVMNVELKGEYLPVRRAFEHLIHAHPWPVQLHSFALKPLLALDHRLLVMNLQLQFWGEGGEASENSENSENEVHRDAQCVRNPFKAE